MNKLQNAETHEYYTIETGTYSTLTETESNNLERPIDYAEITKTLKNMNNYKSPGSSGFTVNFYKVFWNQGIIICIPRENKSKLFIKNWRPITLLNTVYKITSRTIANRIKTVLNKLISNDQTGFIQGRFIGENTRLLYDTMQIT